MIDMIVIEKYHIFVSYGKNINFFRLLKSTYIFVLILKNTKLFFHLLKYTNFDLVFLLDF